MKHILDIGAALIFSSMAGYVLFVALISAMAPSLGVN